MGQVRAVLRDGLDMPCGCPADAVDAVRMIPEIERQPHVETGEAEAAMGDAVRIGHQRKAGHLQRICAVCRSGAQYLRPREAQRRQRSADGRGERGFHRARLQGDEAVQPTMSSSSRPFVSCTRARTKKKETAAKKA